jgi:hypothetical protein
MRYIFSLLLIFSVIRMNAQEEYWDVYLAQHKGKTASILLNMELKKTAPYPDLPFLVIAGVGFGDCTPEGLPTVKEFDNLYRISDSIAAMMKTQGNNKLVGTFTYQCERNDYYYIADTTGIREKLHNKLRQLFPTYKPVINISIDISWSTYLDFLYPNEESYEVMQNQKVVLQLQKAGDKLLASRKIEHWLFFTSERDRSCFLQYAMKQKFKVESIGKDGPLSTPFKLVISRAGIPELQGISQLTLQLRKESHKCNGIYDGWETFVVK